MLTFSPFTFYLVLAIALIAIELIVFQFSLFWMLFIGLGALVATLTAFLIPSASWLLVTATFVISSVVISIVLYRPLRNWQEKPSSLAGHDAIGQRVEVIETVTADKAGKVIWSGTDWRAELDKNSEEIQPGDRAIIVDMEGIRLTIKKS